MTSAEMTTPATPIPPTLRAVLAPGLLALRRYWKPFVLIQSVALALVGAYFLFPAVREWCQVLSAWQKSGGLVAAAIAAAVAGGVLPEIAKLLTKPERKALATRVHDIAFNCLFFGFSGVVVYYFYAYQAVLFGDDAKVSTVVKKVIVDQFGFSIVWATPYALFMFALKGASYSVGGALRELSPAKLVYRVPSMLLPIWAFWIPMVTMIYALPAALQFALFSLALAAWSLLVTVIAGPGREGESTPRPGRAVTARGSP